MVCFSQRQVVWPSHIASMTDSAGGTFQSQKHFLFLEKQLLQLAGLDCVSQEIVKANLVVFSKQTSTNSTVDSQNFFYCVGSLGKCSAPIRLQSERESSVDKRQIILNDIQQESSYLPPTYGARLLNPSIIVAKYKVFSSKKGVGDSLLPSIAQSVICHFDHGAMDTKDALNCPGPSQSSNFACHNSSSLALKTLKGRVMVDSSRRLVEMNSGLLSNKDSTVKREGNCRQALVFDHGDMEDKDRFNSAGPSEIANLTGEETSLTEQKILTTGAGLGSGRHAVSMNVGPLSNGNVIDNGELKCRQTLFIDHDSMSGKDRLHSPGPSLSTNLACHECPALVQKTPRVTAASGSGKCLGSANLMTLSTGKTTDVRDLNSRQNQSSCSIDQHTTRIEEAVPKRLRINPAKGSSTTDLGTSLASFPDSIERGSQSPLCDSGNSRSMYVLHGECFSSQVKRECSGGQSLLSSPLEKPGKQNGHELTREQKEHRFHKVDMSSGLGNRNLEGFICRRNKESSSKSEFQKGDSFADSGVNLLEGLASLDENGIFSDPMNDSFGPDYSKIIGDPMSFSVMHEKIQSQKYRTWKSFVDDFEHICHKALSNTEKGSKVWNAATSLLHRGKKYLGQYADKADMLFGLSIKKEDQKCDHGFEASSNGFCKLENAGSYAVEHIVSKGNTEVTETILLGKLNSELGRDAVHLMQRTSDICVRPVDHILQNVSGSILPCTQNRAYVQEPEENISNFETVLDNMLEAEVQADESVVEILECARDDIRFDPADQVTECSSSFGDTEFDIDDDSGSKMGDTAEVESDLRNGNGAATAAEDDTGGYRKRKKALTLEWRDYRRRIEWRCQWLELRIKQLQSQASKYDQILAEIQGKKLWKDEEHVIKQLTSRSAPLVDHTHRHQFLRRKRRKKVENMLEVSSYMSRHPLFSLYEKKKRMEAEGVSMDDDSNSIRTVTGEVNNRRLDENNFNNQFTGLKTNNGENSVEQLLWHIEALQSRILKMKNQTSKILRVAKHSPKNISDSLLIVESSKSVLPNPASPVEITMIQTPASGGSKLQLASNLSHQHNSDYDISNIVMPCNAMSSYVEPTLPGFIETPHWRLLDTDAILDQPEREDSSNEVTDEEVYMEYHAVMEVKEKKHRDFPHPGKKLSEVEGILGEGTIKHETMRVIEKDVSPTAASESIPNSICLPFDLFVPKCKRKRKHCRSSSIPTVEGTNASTADQPKHSNLIQDYDVKENDMYEGKLKNKTQPFNTGHGDTL